MNSIKLRIAPDPLRNAGSLIDEATGMFLQIGDTVTNFRGDAYTLTGWYAPHKPSSTGRVHVVDADGHTAEFFPSVIGAKIVNHGR